MNGFVRQRLVLPHTDMIVFDVDGTLIDGEKADWSSFQSAFEEVAGFVLTPTFFAGIEEVTAQAIVHQALAALPLEERRRKERAIREDFLSRLQAACVLDAAAFRAVQGAVVLLRELQHRGIPVAIATGDWRETITLKLRTAGIAFEDIPLVTSSEFYSRAEIITSAVEKAGGVLQDAIYVGDGLWDLRACKQLGIRFVGVGRRAENLRAAGALHVLADLSPELFWKARDALEKIARV